MCNNTDTTCYDLAPESRSQDDAAACSVAGSALSNLNRILVGKHGVIDGDMGGQGQGGLWRQEADLFF
jgi:hypothetical protein